MQEICRQYYSEDGSYLDKCMRQENYCTYCCVAVYGKEYENDKMKCLEGCLKQDHNSVIK